MGGGGDDIGVGHRARIDTRCNQAGVVGHVDHENGANFLGHLGKTGPVGLERVGRGTGNQQLGPVFTGQGLHAVVVDFFTIVEAIGHHLEPFARHVERHAMGEVATLGQRQAHDGVAWIQKRQKDRRVGLRPRMRLHVGRLAAIELLEPIDGELLHHIHMLAATVVTLAWVALGILVGELRALCRHDRRACIVLGGDQLNVGLLPGMLGRDGCSKGRVGLGIGLGTVKHGMSCKWVETAAQPGPSMARARTTRTRACQKSDGQSEGASAGPPAESPGD